MYRRLTTWPEPKHDKFVGATECESSALVLFGSGINVSSGNAGE